MAKLFAVHGDEGILCPAEHLSLPSEFYSAMHILVLMGFMALGRIRRPEGLRHVPPGELGKVVGLDRAPEVRTLRKKVEKMATSGTPDQWQRDLSKTWMEADPQEAGYLYLDGHVRVYHGTQANLPRRYVTRERLCLRGTTDYWVNDAIGRPFFVVSKTVNDGLASTLLEEIVPELMKSVPQQPTEAELADDPLLHRFVVIFDREGSTHELLSQLWKQRIAGMTYRKAVKDVWPESEFSEVTVPVPGGGSTVMKIATRKTAITSGKNSLPVHEIRRLTKTKHQTAIITTAYHLPQEGDHWLLAGSRAPYAIASHGKNPHRHGQDDCLSRRDGAGRALAQASEKGRRSQSLGAGTPCLLRRHPPQRERKHPHRSHPPDGLSGA